MGLKVYHELQRNTQMRLQAKTIICHQRIILTRLVFIYFSGIGETAPSQTNFEYDF